MNMTSDILIVRDADRYRLLHGHLRLASVMSAADEVMVHVRNEGAVKIVKTRAGYFVRGNGQQLALVGN